MRKRLPDNAESIAERAGKNMLIGSDTTPTGWMNTTSTGVECFQEQLNQQQQAEETITRIRRGRVCIRVIQNVQKFTDIHSWKA